MRVAAFGYGLGQEGGEDQRWAESMLNGKGAFAGYRPKVPSTPLAALLLRTQRAPSSLIARMLAAIHGHLPFHPESAGASRAASRRFRNGLARALGGAVIFALPMLMTLEMWTLGRTMPAMRLALLLLVTLPLLVGLSRLSGFEQTGSWLQDVIDAFVACAVGAAASTLILVIFGELAPGTSLRAAIGVVTLQAIPASIGALLAQSQFGQGDADDRLANGEGGSYWGELLVMAIGALFLAFNVAPTEEMVLISYGMSRWAVLALALLSLLSMHAFVYAVDFRGQESIPEGGSPMRAFIMLTVTGYALVLLMSAYVLWSFGRFDESSFGTDLSTTVVLAFPGAIGAAAARLIL